MTFCLGIKVKEGLVGIADTRVTSGTEQITARKVTVHQHGQHSYFLMTSGLRSARDKALTYFEEVIDESDATFDKLYKAVNAFAQQIRRVAKEDRRALEQSGLFFNLHALVGGQLENDSEHKLYLIYPEANWVEVSQGSPYYIIGESGYGKPLLDRLVRYETGMPEALKAGYLAFDATRTSATDVDFPMDVVVYKSGTYTIVEHRYEQDALKSVAEWWQDNIRDLASRAPSDWMEAIFSELDRRISEEDGQP